MHANHVKGVLALPPHHLLPTTTALCLRTCREFEAIRGSAVRNDVRREQGVDIAHKVTELVITPPSCNSCEGRARMRRRKGWHRTRSAIKRCGSRHCDSCSPTPPCRRKERAQRARPVSCDSGARIRVEALHELEGAARKEPLASVAAAFQRGAQLLQDELCEGQRRGWEEGDEGRECVEGGAHARARVRSSNALRET